jgi:dTDP-4-dehydrorhamnose 3,5-epimerase
MRIHKTSIPDLLVIETKSHADSRGFLTRLYCESELNEIIGSRKIVQINQTQTFAAGALRGLHFQAPPYAEMKIVRCIKGRVWDVAVDLRKNSSTFLQWHAEELSPDNARSVIIPEGFAHGFQAIEAYSEILYLHTNFYCPKSEGGLRYDDPSLAINWPLSVKDLSERDCSHPLLESNFNGVSL